MYVSEFMTTSLITITGDEPVARAARLIYAHNIRRLPVVDYEGRLIGIIGDRAVSAAMPTAATGLSSKEMSNTLSKMKVCMSMQPDVVTITADTTVENVVSLAQDNKVGSLVVVDDQYRPVGIVTTNDVIYRVLNPLLGLGSPGVRLHIYDCGKIEQIRQVTELIEKHDLELEVIHLDKSPKAEKSDLIVQVITRDPGPLVHDLTGQGYKVEIRKRKSWPLAGDE
ncbi:MAG: CBS domain-containing protein [Chloroflexota bacterium]|nr:CBS domain-containing protein [Chloroflexota bacterium]